MLEVSRGSQHPQAQSHGVQLLERDCIRGHYSRVCGFWLLKTITYNYPSWWKDGQSLETEADEMLPRDSCTAAPHLFSLSQFFQTGGLDFQSHHQAAWWWPRLLGPTISRHFPNTHFIFLPMNIVPKDAEDSCYCVVSVHRLTVAAAAAKSLQSCPTLCDPIDGVPLNITLSVEEAFVEDIPRSGGEGGYLGTLEQFTTSGRRRIWKHPDVKMCWGEGSHHEEPEAKQASPRQPAVC